MTDFVAYYRVSTDKQGAAGLGMDAQKEAVTRFIGERGQIVSEYIEVESGRKNNRPQLSAALEECRSRRATLIIAKLDRLARNVHFISGLMESGVDFLAVDMPDANRLTIHVLAAVAEHEREMISQRTKAALAQAKARGTKLGNPKAAEAAAIGRAAIVVQKPPAQVLKLMRGWRADGLSYEAVAHELNRLGVRTARGKQWYGCSVRNQMIRLWRRAARKGAEPMDSQDTPEKKAPPRRMTQSDLDDLEFSEGKRLRNLGIDEDLDPAEIFSILSEMLRQQKAERQAKADKEPGA